MYCILQKLLFVGGCSAMECGEQKSAVRKLVQTLILSGFSARYASDGCSNPLCW